MSGSEEDNLPCVRYTGRNSAIQGRFNSTANQLGLFNNMTSQAAFSAQALPRDRWFCLEASIEIGDAGTVEASVDGAGWLTAPTGRTLPANGFDELTVGAIYAAPYQQVPAELWVDDVVVSREPVGCDLP